jgi:hypothetical protein
MPADRPGGKRPIIPLDLPGLAEAVAEHKNTRSPLIRPAVVIVEWHDSYVASEGWTDRQESVDSGREMTGDPISSAGFLIDDDEVGIIVASGLNQHANDVFGAMALPRSAIVNLKVLEKSHARLTEADR